MSLVIDTMTPRARAGFERRIDRSGGPTACWPWTGVLSYNGYGRFSFRYLAGPEWRTKHARAHRLAWVLSNGSIPDEHEIDHLCRNRRCVNPAHLEPVTRATNADRARPFRSSLGSIERRVTRRGAVRYRVVKSSEGRKTYTTFESLEEAERFRRVAS